MKFTTAIALVGVANCATSKVQATNENLSTLLTDAFKGEPFALTIPPTAGAKAGDIREKLPGVAPNYTYDWKYVCAFTKWTPSNQFLHSKKVYATDGSMTLERFGFIGEARQCFWGMTGVYWKQPLKIEQLIPKSTTP